MTAIGILALLLIPIVVIDEIRQRYKLRKARQELVEEQARRWWQRAIKR